MNLEELNIQQRKAVKHMEGPVLVLAGAGSGKTTVLKYRTAYLLEKGIEPENILILTFTNKAANEIKSRVLSMLGDERGARVKACTYHRFCTEVLRNYSHLVNIENNFTIMSATDSEDAIKLLASEMPCYEDKSFPTAKKIFQIFSWMKNAECNLDEAVSILGAASSLYFSEITLLLQKYTNYKEEHNLLDYGDLLYFTNLLLALNPSVRRDYCKQYQYKMVDEYQDTNNAQFTLINNLCKYGNDNLMIVGDPAQCIMSFQGANVQNILKFPEKFENCRIIKLERNYRSTQEILDMANATLEMMPSELNLSLVSNKGHGEKPIVKAYQNPITEASGIVEYVKNRYALNHKSINKIAVLTRRAFDTYLLEARLLREGIPYQKIGGPKFMERVYVKDILAFLKVTVNEKDEIAWFRILNLCQGIGGITSRKITKGIIENGPEFLKDNEHYGKKYEDDIHDIYDIYNLIKGKSLTDQITYLLMTYFQLVEENIKQKKISDDKRRSELAENRKNADEANILTEFAVGYKDTKSFLTDITLEEPVNAEEGALTISTIHSAKGKEWEQVIFMNCIDYDMDHKNGQAEQEARRCFYVAITRAKSELIITYPQCNRGKYQNKSSFLNESSKIMMTYKGECNG